MRFRQCSACPSAASWTHRDTYTGMCAAKATRECCVTHDCPYGVCSCLSLYVTAAKDCHETAIRCRCRCTIEACSRHVLSCDRAVFLFVFVQCVIGADQPAGMLLHVCRTGSMLRTSNRPLAVGCCCVCRGRVYRVHSFDYQGHVVWGLTAAILIQVAELALGRPPDFEVDHPSNMSTNNQSRM